MAKIRIDGKEVECRDGIPVLRAALEAGMEVPHYCYHPGLSIVASCRLCLMEMKLPDPRTKEVAWVPKLFPSCQTPVKDGMEVRFQSPAVADNQKHTMEYYLLNHPLDCPVCDKAGECYLQDYTEDFGPAASRMVEEKHKNPKKDIGEHTLLYQDRCVLCTRCVRFCDEVAGTSELTVVNRGNRGEIDVFPGQPLANELQGNVVDLCPVGALLDKDFLFKQRVWELRTTPSVCAGCARGCTIDIDHNDAGIHRIRPRHNERVNHWWICDDGRFGWKYVAAADRRNQPRIRRGAEWEALRWEDVPDTLSLRLGQAAEGDDGARVAAVFSPMMSCEEAWLLAKFVRKAAPAATLALGYVPQVGSDQTFKAGFTILAEKCPNLRGVAAVLASFGGRTADFSDFLRAAGESKFAAAYVAGGYPQPWVSDATAQALAKVPFVALHDILPGALDAHATVALPGLTWAEREGSFVNRDGLWQAFERALPPLEGVKADGQLYQELAGEPGLFRAGRVREKMRADVAALGELFVPRPEPEFAH